RRRGGERAVWPPARSAVGVLSSLLAGVCAPGRLGKHRGTFGLLDLLLPDRLWPRAFKCLPATRWHVCAAAWSLAVALCGVIWVGGWTYWLPRKAEPSPTRRAVSKHLREAAGQKDEDLEEEAPADAKTTEGSPKAAGAKDGEESEEPAAPKKTVTRCVIVGYRVDEKGLSHLLTATVHGDEVRYAGEVPVGDDAALK